MNENLGKGRIWRKPNDFPVAQRRVRQPDKLAGPESEKNTAFRGDTARKSATMPRTLATFYLITRIAFVGLPLAGPETGNKAFLGDPVEAVTVELLRGMREIFRGPFGPPVSLAATAITGTTAAPCSHEVQDNPHAFHVLAVQYNIPSLLFANVYLK